VSTSRKFSAYGEWLQGHLKIQGYEVSPGELPSPNILILWGFLQILRVETAESNHAWTEWRRVRDSNPR
jgi:hypothetical protein